MSQYSEVEEVVLFPELTAPTEVPEELGMAPESEALRTWLTTQLSQVEGQLRKHKLPSKPAGVNAEVAAYFEARATQDRLKASKDAYMKALNKLAHYARRSEEAAR